jgi:(S)-ureidoglycine aminohydrolase
MPLEGFPVSRLPGWPKAAVFVLASPPIGAGFAEYLIDLPAGESGGWAAEPHIETFHYVLCGTGSFADGSGIDRPLTAGSFGLTPPDSAVNVRATEPLRMIMLRKRYEPSPLHPKAVGHYGHESKVKKEVWADNPHSLLQTLIPDDLAFDLAMNIFTFDPGFGLPIVETHVMEHGLWFLEGKGLYYLENEWMEVEKDDFIWMGPYCPQSFYATGPTPSRYLYSKNVNRDITL